MAAYLPAVFFRNWNRSYDELECVQISVPVEDEGRALCGLLSFLDLLLFLESDAASHLSTHLWAARSTAGTEKSPKQGSRVLFSARFGKMSKCFNVVIFSDFLIH